ncbi:MAG: asparagine synthase (glutamine-hydrolyzing) [Candidatus Pacebacteria bacterium]|nr:asparagine synthase (glutamine-hydrolyzing) [Candidatus Paceibacterota bacterium]
MCGIVGIYNFKRKPVSESQIKKMTGALAHRGPDGEGIFVDKNLGLGHKRLAIIDLSKAGHQPMSNEKGEIWITYNGEIYNFQDLKRELEKLGHRFKSKTDTEVIIHSFEQWGVDCVRRFNGMFAFGIWDKKNQTLTLARDRYGIKPLYYWQNQNVFLFASEIKAFLKHPEFKAVSDPEALLEYFTFQNTFSYKTLFKGVKILPQGTILNISLKGEPKFNLKKYWDFSFTEERNKKSEKEYSEELDRLFKQAVKRQLISDVEIGAYLSGGIDTGSITAITSQFFPNLKTFCVGFDLTSASGIELSFDERKKAESLSHLYQTEHYEMVLKSGDLKRCLPDLVWHLEDLRVGQSYPNFYASKLVSKFVKVCLSGGGGDELFGGYPWRYYRAMRSKSFNDYIENYYKYWQRLVPNQTLKELFSPIRNEVKNVWTQDIFKNVFNSKQSLPQTADEYISRSLYFEAKTFLHGLLLVEDKLSMAHSLEVRVPFLDNDLVDFAMKVPVRMKLNNIDKVLEADEDELNKYYNKTQDGKMILRKVLSKYVPDKIANQEKQGFSGPDASWFKGESIDYIKDLLLNKKANIFNYFDYKTVKTLIEEHISGKQNRRLFIWSLLCFEWWNRIFINKNINI